MSASERIDVLNESGEAIATISREEAERDNHITQNVLVFLFNSSGRVWTQLRSHDKKHFPGRWDISACGGVISGETPEQAARREAYEETGLAVELQYIETFLNVFPGDTGEERKRLSYLFIGLCDELPLQNEEVDGFKDWEPSELRADVTASPNDYIPSFIVELDKAIDGYNKLKQAGN